MGGWLAGQGFYRVMRIFYRPFRWLLFDKLCDGAGGFGSHAGEDVLGDCLFVGTNPVRGDREADERLAEVGR